MAFLADCVGQFNRDIDGLIAEMRAALAAGDLDGYRIKIHAVKGILATLGVDDLSARARTLEEAAKAGDAGACNEGSEEAFAAFTALRDRLGAALASKPSGETAAALLTLSFVLEKLAALRKAARSRDLDEAEAIAGELDGAAIEGQEQTALWQAGWPKVKAAIDGFSFGGIAAEAEALRSSLAAFQ
jgi:HPt (histidine-containing phosphotransfer) domain-containing protein